MDENVTGTPDASVQDSGGVTAEQNKQPQDAKQDEAYLNQKLRAEKAEARAEAAEQRVKELSNQSKENSTTNISAEEVRLIAQGFDENSITKLKRIAEIEGVSLSEAKEGDMFKRWHKGELEKIKREKASLAASNKSGSQGARKSFASAGLSEADHRELFNKRMGR